jgi:hypothetical protein
MGLTHPAHSACSTPTCCKGLRPACGEEGEPPAPLLGVRQCWHRIFPGLRRRGLPSRSLNQPEEPSGWLRAC